MAGDGRISFDLDASADKAIVAFDEALRAMDATKAASERLKAEVGGIEAVAERAGVSTAQAAKLIEQAVKQAAKESERAQQQVATATERAAKQAAAAAVKAAKEQEAAQVKAAKEAEKALERMEKMAVKAYREQQKEAQRAAREAEKAAASAGNSWNQIAKRMQSNQVISDIEQLGGMLGLVGGNVSKFGMLLSSTVRPVSMLSEALTTAFGPQAPVILGLLAIPAAGLAAVATLKKLADAGFEASERIEKLGGKVAPESKRAFTEYKESTERLNAAIDRLVVSIGDDLADVLADLTVLLAVVIENADKIQEKTDFFSRVTLAALTLGLSETIRLTKELGVSALDQYSDMASAGQRTAEGIANASKAASMSAAQRAKIAVEEKKLQAEILKDKRKAFDEQLERDKRREKELAAEAKRLKSEADRRLREEKQTQEKLHDIVASGMDELMTEEGKLYATRNERIRQLDELAISEEQYSNAVLDINEQTEAQLQQLYQKRWDDAKEKRDEAYEDEKAAAESFQRDIGRMLADRARDDAEAQKEALESSLAEMADVWLEFTQTIAELRMEALQEDLDGLKKRTEGAREQLAEQWEDFRNATRNMTQEDRKRIREASKAERDATRERIDALREEQAEKRKAIREAFAVSQAAATAQVIMQGALAYMAMVAGLAVSLGPLAPAAPFMAAGIVLPTVGAQLATIASQKAPAHSGKTFGADEFFVGDQLVRQGERGAIFNQRAVEQGAVEQAKAANEGKMTGGGSAPARLVLADGGRVIGEAVVSELRRPGSRLARAVGSTPRGFSDPYRRRGR